MRVELMRQVPGPLPDYCRLPQGYVLEIATGRRLCECGMKLRTQWLQNQSPRGILLGAPQLRHRIKQCPHCRRVYRSEQLAEMVPAHGNYAFDLIVQVGLARFREHQQNEEIRRHLLQRFGLNIPCTTIRDLAGAFLDYLAGVHQTHADTIRELLHAHGGYALHVDGTCEAGTEIVFAAMDGRTGLVLSSKKMSTENVADITEFLRECVRSFGRPLSVMRDLSKNIGDAVKAVLPDVVALVCHYHFLQTVGARLCESHHRRLAECIRRLTLKRALKSVRSELVKCSKTGTHISQEQMLTFLQNPESMLQLDAVQLRRYLSYLLLRWLEDYAADMKGEYFPFDLPEMTFLRRCKRLHSLLEKLLERHQLKAHQFQTFQTIREKLAPVAEDTQLRAAMARLEKAEVLFNELRAVLRFKSIRNQPLLRQSSPRTTIESALQTEERLIAFRTQLEHLLADPLDLDRCADARVLLDYLGKYWNELFGHAIFLDGKTEPVLVSRTNNAIEQAFAHSKQQLRRKLGLKKLTRCMQAMRPEELLVANLNSQPYLDALYGGSLENMPAVFSEHRQRGATIRKQRLQTLSSHPMLIRRKDLRDPTLLSRIETGMDALIGSNIPSCPAA